MKNIYRSSIGQPDYLKKKDPIHTGSFHPLNLHFINIGKY